MLIHNVRDIHFHISIHMSNLNQLIMVPRESGGEAGYGVVEGRALFRRVVVGCVQV
jgi:hypothetical protein